MKNITRLASLLSVATLVASFGALAACAGSEPPVAAPPMPSASAPADTTPPAASAAPAASDSSAAATPPPPPEPTKPAASLSLHDAGFQTPESVFYDAKNDVYLVSNINGGPSAADNNGFISRVSADGSKVELKWIEAGKKGVKLDAPKGLTAVGDVLYVADLTRVRTFDLSTGKPKGEIALKDATFANDLAADPDGTVYASDSGIKIDASGVTPTKSDAIYAIKKGKAVKIAKGDDLGHPNGLLWVGDSTNGKLWCVTFGSGELYSVDTSLAAYLGKPAPKGNVVKLPKGQLDGLVSLADGSLLVSSWEAQAIYRGTPGGTFTLVIPGLKAPADIGYDTKRGRVLAPLFQDSAVEAYDIK
jgi:sugar lactone lactonase YvrE